MNVTAVAQAATETISPTLWRTWLDNGLGAIEQGDYSGAIAWLHEAIQHVCAGGVDDRLHALTEGHLAYAHFLLGRKLCAQAEDPCTPDCDRKQLEAAAQKAFGHASAYAASASPRLEREPQSALTSLATARAAHVAGENCFKANELGPALARFEVARQRYLDVPLPVAALDEVYFRLYAINYRLDDFRKGLEHLRDLENRAARRNDRVWLAHIAAAQADSRLRLGEYRVAFALYERWQGLAPRCDQGSDDGYSCAYALVTFGRLHLILGYYDIACRLLSRAKALIDCLGSCDRHPRRCTPPNEDALRFDVALLLAELALKQGDYACAKALLTTATELKPVWRDRKIHLCLVTGQLNFVLGSFTEACACFTEARQLAEGMQPCRLVLLIPAILGLARVESETSNWPAAISLASLAVHMLENSPYGVSAEMAQSLLGLAMAYVRDDRSDRAFPPCERARHLFNMSLRAGHPEGILLQLTLAEHHVSRNQLSEAIAASDRALQLVQQFMPSDGFAIARILRIQGEAYQVDRQTACALQYFECARTRWKDQEACLSCEHSEKALILLDIAVGHISNGDTADASQLLKEFKPLLCVLKGNAAGAGYEVNRRANLFLAASLFREAEWLYCVAEDYYRVCYGLDHEFTRQVQANCEKAKQYQKEACPPHMLDRN